MKNLLRISLLLLTALLMNFNGRAQQKNLIDFYFAPTFSSINLNREVYVKPKLGLRFDLGINYQRIVSDKFLLGSGIGFSRMGYNTEQPAHIDGVGTGDYWHIRKYRDFIELPLMAGYLLVKDEKKSITFDLSIINQLLIGVQEKETDNKLLGYPIKYSFSELKSRGWDTYGLSLLVGGSYRKSISDSLNLRLSPFVKYGLIKMGSSHDYSVGLKIGLGLIY